MLPQCIGDIARHAVGQADIAVGRPLYPVIGHQSGPIPVLWGPAIGGMPVALGRVEYVGDLVE